MKRTKNGAASLLLKRMEALLMGMGALLVTTSMLTACSEAELPTTSHEAWMNDPDALRISVNVGGITANGNRMEDGAITRSNPMGDMADIADDIKGEQTAFRLGDKIGISAEGQGTVIYTLTGADLASAVWTPEAGKYLKWTGSTMEVSAYYPVNDNNGGVTNDVKNFTLPTAQGINLSLSYPTKQIAGADYMTYIGIATRPDGSTDLSLQMTRRTARVIINLTSVGDEVDKAKEAIMIANLRSPYSTYANDVAAGTTRIINPYADRLGENGFSNSTYTRYTALVIPAAEDKTTTAEPWLEIQRFDTSSDGLIGRLYVSTVPAMEAGKSYTYNLKVGKDKVTIAGITVQDWATGAVLPDQEAEEEPQN